MIFGFGVWASGLRFLRSLENFFVKEFFWFDQVYPLLGPKNDFMPIWPMWYQLRHVLMVQIVYALKLKPHLHNDDDLWKKNWHFMYWKLPYSYNIGQNLPKKTASQYRYLERSKWAVLWNLSLIPTLMMIRGKNFGCLDTQNLWAAFIP